MPYSENDDLTENEFSIASTTEDNGSSPSPNETSEFMDYPEIDDVPDETIFSFIKKQYPGLSDKDERCEFFNGIDITACAQLVFEVIHNGDLTEFLDFIKANQATIEESQEGRKFIFDVRKALNYEIVMSQETEFEAFYEQYSNALEVEDNSSALAATPSSLEGEATHYNDALIAALIVRREAIHVEEDEAEEDEERNADLPVVVEKTIHPIISRLNEGNISNPVEFLTEFMKVVRNLSFTFKEAEKSEFVQSAYSTEGER